ncbi:MAG: protoporphyrinogen oxidase [Deltaproteobacteria bacterium]|nr:protoporphyrinogen oxidase [Deltaproteobacteria bacterium]
MRVAVVGGGLGGLAAARTLRSAGVDVHVFEASPRAGGVLGTSSSDGYVREHAASSFLGGPARGALALCKELGVAVERASPKARRRWIYIDGKLRALPQDPVSLVRSDLLTWRGKLDLLREPFRPSQPAANGDESVYDFAARRLGAEAARAIVAPFVTGVYAADAHDISLEAGFPRLAALEAHGGLARGLARQAALGVFGKVVSLASGRRRSDGTERGLWAPVGGLGALVAALAADLGDRVHAGAPVARIEPGAGGVRLVLGGSSGASLPGDTWDGAVLAIPAEDAGGVVAVPGLGARMAGFHRAPAAIVYLGYREEDVPRARDGFGALVALGEDVRVLGIVFESVVWSRRAPAGHVLLRCIFGGGRDPAAAGLDDAALIAQATRDAGVIVGAAGTPAHASVVRWKRGVAQYGLGHRERVRAAVTAARTHRIALAGADYMGPGLNDLCTDTARILDEVRAW